MLRSFEESIVCVLWEMEMVEGERAWGEGKPQRRCLYVIGTYFKKSGQWCPIAGDAHSQGMGL